MKMLMFKISKLPLPSKRLPHAVARASLLTERMNERVKDVKGYSVTGMCVCAQVGSPLRPSPPPCQYLSASASTGGWHDGTQKQMRRLQLLHYSIVHILLLDKVIVCSDADATHFCISLLFTCTVLPLYSSRPVQTYSGIQWLPPSNGQWAFTGRTQSLLPRLHNRIGTCTSHLLWG